MKKAFGIVAMLATIWMFIPLCKKDNNSNVSLQTPAERSTDLIDKTKAWLIWNCFCLHFYIAAVVVSLRLNRARLVKGLAINTGIVIGLFYLAVFLSDQSWR